MATKRKFLIKKIVRDELHTNPAKSNIQSIGYQLNLEQAIFHMKAKLIEEAEEVVAATNQAALAEELGDVLEVIEGLARAAGIPYENIERAKQKKREARGGFESYYYVEHVILEEDHPIAAYFLAHPHKYPEIKE